jgi:hypothetical protein
MRAFRAFTQIKVLNTSVETGLVIGMSPSTTPIGSAISVSASRSLLPTTPTPGFPTSDCATSRLANRFLSALSVTEPMPVSATVAAASSSAWSAISVASAVIRPSTSSSDQPAMLCWAAADRATSASMAGSGSPVRMNSSRSFEKARAFVAALRASQRSIMTPVGGSRSHSSRSAPADRRRATTSVCAYTLADRGLPSSRPNSPQTVPGPMYDTTPSLSKSGLSTSTRASPETMK